MKYLHVVFCKQTTYNLNLALSMSCNWCIYHVYLSTWNMPQRYVNHYFIFYFIFFLSWIQVWWWHQQWSTGSSICLISLWMCVMSVCSWHHSSHPWLPLSHTTSPRNSRLVCNKINNTGCLRKKYSVVDYRCYVFKHNKYKLMYIITHPVEVVEVVNYKSNTGN